MIVLLHGYLESSDVWRDIIPELARFSRVITMDLPGAGESDVFGSEHTMEFMADAVRSLMDELAIEKVMIVGHSLGGYVALAFLELFPDRLRCYCLFHSHPMADTDEVIANRKREIKIVESGKKDIIYPVNIPKMFADCNLEKFETELEYMKEVASRIPAEGIIALIKGMISRPSRLDLLEKGEVPLLYILGRMDNYIPYELFNIIIRMPKNAELVTFENSGHLGFIEEKEKTVNVLREFFENNFHN